MPNNYDFSRVKEGLKTASIEVEGWISPLFVEYAIQLHGGIPSYFWRVKGTEHTLDFLSKGDYEAHFKETLSGFREDYKGWATEGWYADWMQEYREQYGNFISL